MFQNHLISFKKIKSTFNNKYYNIKYSYGVIQFFVIKYELRKKKFQSIQQYCGQT